MSRKPRNKVGLSSTERLAIERMLRCAAPRRLVMLGFDAPVFHEFACELDDEDFGQRREWWSGCDDALEAAPAGFARVSTAPGWSRFAGAGLDWLSMDALLLGPDTSDDRAAQRLALAAAMGSPKVVVLVGREYGPERDLLPYMPGTLAAGSADFLAVVRREVADASPGLGIATMGKEAA